MRTVFVGIAGGVGSGKNHFAKNLVARLAQRKVKAVPIEVSSSEGLNETQPIGDCVIYHGPTVLRDTRLKPKLDLKVFLDIDGDVRLSNMMKNGNLESLEKYNDVRSFHSDFVMKQKKIADIWINEINNAKLTDVVNVIEKVRRQPAREEDVEPEEIRVYLDNYDQRSLKQ
ncbi:unnamed protein product [Auanema sp. JU1783]|nr:unnamed protein product [Auanema sp. JU1783]